ncbi:uncharacterized protein LAESUDRAFT_716530 [Laetiporus sulphureus 93-53]|uniref:Uncharacterized protein n=1 Tax=Laetiporus sulphureus 93-53 TaxID=1314785 RepID=A0A165CK01_9APHY|nr:uncharacterized protein LAESUDRAFT_716530 [Laetiporus sulphureus 93-53]KZT02949.1 hypothetical protein LAESUDRAFT_716530 [Laetiporus sulphureus 93-53]
MALPAETVAPKLDLAEWLVHFRTGAADDSRPIQCELPATNHNQTPRRKLKLSMLQREFTRADYNIPLVRVCFRSRKADILFTNTEHSQTNAMPRARKTVQIPIHAMGVYLRPRPGPDPEYLDPAKRKIRGNRGHIIWFSSVGNKPISFPNRIRPGTVLKPGTLFIHRIESENDARPVCVQIWIVDAQQAWQMVANAMQQKHPMLKHMVLILGRSGNPNWVTRKTADRHIEPEVLVVEAPSHAQPPTEFNLAISHDEKRRVVLVLDIVLDKIQHVDSDEVVWVRLASSTRRGIQQLGMINWTTYTDHGLGNDIVEGWRACQGKPLTPAQTTVLDTLLGKPGLNGDE